MFIAAQKLLHKHGRLFFAIIGVMIVLPFVFWGTTGVNRETEEPRGTIMGKSAGDSSEFPEQRRHSRRRRCPETPGMESNGLLTPGQGPRSASLARPR